MQKEYWTVAGEATAEIEEKKSRFIANVKPVSSEEEAALFISTLKSKYWNATHNVYAYYIRGNSTYQKFSDDGEPAGTAGMPVLEAIKKLGVQDIVVVVTRFFGGTLLGAAGLVRAYGKSASFGIEAAIVIKRQLCIEAEIDIEYTYLGKVQSLLASKGYGIKDTSYGQDVRIISFVPVDGYADFELQIIEVTNARALISAGNRCYVSLGK